MKGTVEEVLKSLREDELKVELELRDLDENAHGELRELLEKEARKQAIAPTDPHPTSTPDEEFQLATEFGEYLKEEEKKVTNYEEALQLGLRCQHSRGRVQRSKRFWADKKEADSLATRCTKRQ